MRKVSPSIQEGITQTRSIGWCRVGKLLRIEGTDVSLVSVPFQRADGRVPSATLVLTNTVDGCIGGKLGKSQISTRFHESRSFNIRNVGFVVVIDNSSLNVFD